MGREFTFILHTVFMNDADTVCGWQNKKKKGEEKKGAE